MSSSKHDTPLLEFASDAYGIWSWALYDDGEIIASCNGFDSRPSAAEGFTRLGLPDTQLLLDRALPQPSSQGVVIL